MSYNHPIVIDIGSGYIKVGFAGEEEPSEIIPNLVGLPKYEALSLSGGDANLKNARFVGEEANKNRGLCLLSHPMEHGVVNNWDEMINILDSVFNSKKLSLSQGSHPVLLTEPILNPTLNQQKLYEILFETFRVPALKIYPCPVLSLYASGRTTGTVVDCGAGVTQVMSIVDGYCLNPSMVRMDIGGRDITRYLKDLLRKDGYTFTTSAEFEIIDEMKCSCCELNNKSTVQKQYALPDGVKINLKSDSINAPSVLFEPSLIGSEEIGISGCVIESIMKSDIDLRRNLFSSIVLCGGSTLFKGFGKLLLDEITKRAPPDIGIRISAPPKRLTSAWVGGSLLASLPSFSEQWYTIEKYQQNKI